MKGMKKSLALLTVLAVCGSCAQAKVFSIDSTRILRESREGRNIISATENERKKLMDKEYEESKKVAKMRDDIEEAARTGKLTNEDMQEKYEELGRAQRKAKYIVESAREDFKVKEQRKVLKFRGKVHKVAGEFFKKHSDSVVFDKATPGIIYVSESTDKTDTLIKELNSRFAKENAKLALTKPKDNKA